MPDQIPPPPGSGSTQPLPGGSEFVIRRFKLDVLSGPDKGLAHIAQGDQVSIGTALSNQLVLKDPTVSRHHCHIAASPDGYLLTDLDSTNGTTLAGYGVRGAFLKRGAVIGVGESLLRFDTLQDQIREPLSAEDRFGRALGSSLAMRRIFTMLPKIAASDSTVLLEGETGTGKSLLAQAIHQESRRADGPFVVLDCGAIAPTLIESELFGHEKGAFTGAQSARTGAFEVARGGTIFIDEIGELPLDMQPKLLRALEDREIKRIGSNTPIKLDARVIAATNRGLREMVNRGTFRSDLFFRLDIIRLWIPPLRERPEDILLLAAHFYEQYSRDIGGQLPAPTLAAFKTRSWPGNVRELRASVERAVLLGEADAAAPAESPPPPRPGRFEMTQDFDATMPFRACKERVVAQWEQWYLAELLRRADGKVARAARSARMDRNHLYDPIKRHKVVASDE